MAKGLEGNEVIEMREMGKGTTELMMVKTTDFRMREMRVRIIKTKWSTYQLLYRY